MAEVCSLILGNRGSGKSMGLMAKLLKLGIEREWAVVCFDRPGTLAEGMIGQLWRNGVRRRTYIEYAKAVDKTLSWPFTHYSFSTDPHQQKNDDELAIEEMTQAFYARRNIKGGQNAPYTDKYSKGAIGIWRSQKTPKPLDWLRWIFRPGTQLYNLMMDDATDRESVAAFSEAALRAERNPIQWETETGAASRMLQPASSPAVFLRNGESINWTTMLEQKSQVYFDLSGVTADAARTLTIFGYTAVINACRRYFDEHRKPLKVVIVLEEAGALDLLTPLIITAMQELRKAGVVVFIVSQTILDFQNADLFEQMMSLCDSHVIYRLNSGIDRIAKDLATRTFDPLEVHYTRERMVNAGVKEIKTKSTGKSFGPDGHERHDEREGVSFITQYEPVIEEFYKPYQIKEHEWGEITSNLLPGHRIVSDLAGVRKEYVSLLPPPWNLGTTPTRTTEAIQEIRNRSCYQAPKNFPIPAEQPTKGKKGVR